MNAVITAPRAPKQRIVATAWLRIGTDEKTVFRGYTNEKYSRKAEEEERLGEGADGNGGQNRVDGPPHKQAAPQRSLVQAPDHKSSPHTHLFQRFFVSRWSSGTRSTPRASTPLAKPLASSGPRGPKRRTYSSSGAASATGTAAWSAGAPFSLSYECELWADIGANVGGGAEERRARRWHRDGPLVRFTRFHEASGYFCNRLQGHAVARLPHWSARLSPGKVECPSYIIAQSSEYKQSIQAACCPFALRNGTLVRARAWGKSERDSPMVILSPKDRAMPCVLLRIRTCPVIVPPSVRSTLRFASASSPNDT